MARGDGGGERGGWARRRASPARSPGEEVVDGECATLEGGRREREEKPHRRHASRRRPSGAWGEFDRDRLDSGTALFNLVLVLYCFNLLNLV
jgi:hypothetical protein